MQDNIKRKVDLVLIICGFFFFFFIINCAACLLHMPVKIKGMYKYRFLSGGDIIILVYGISFGIHLIIHGRAERERGRERKKREKYNNSDYLSLYYKECY